MNLAWILLLAQMSTPPLPMKGRIVCWRNLEHKVVCINSAGEYVPVPIRENPPKPEPMDVPAVHRKGPKAVGHTNKDGSWWDCGDYSYPDDVDIHNDKIQPQCWTRWTCADRTRVLLTSEDGKKHCIKFPGE